MRTTLRPTLTRRTATVGLVAVGAAAGLAACSAPGSGGGESDDAPDEEIPETPSEAVALNIFDVAGAQKELGPMIEKWAEDHPEIVSSVNFESGDAPSLVGQIKPQVDSGRLEVDLVLTGNDGLSAGIGSDLWIPLIDSYGDRLGNQDTYLEAAASMQELASGYGIVLSYYPSGPLLQYNPDKVDEVPTTPEDLLAWAKEHPGEFGYARPANSGPGRTFLMGLPYILGDSDPKDPENGWEKTWEYLKDLGQYVDNYPSGTGQVISNMADGSWNMIPTTTGWDINPRATGQLPAEYEAAAFDEFTWVTDAHYAVIPVGQSADKISALLNLLNGILEPEYNAMAYDEGYFYPGPAVEGATLDLAPEESQKVVEEFGRDWYDELIDSAPQETPLEPDLMVKAFDLWDREVGSQG
ncbi:MULTISPECIES: extracellular solute-binding protein [Brachybacterium]|uniref:ABC transporter substrate-binding protein n=1 Tax=Brachybacterium alimentarium TaxID=47845 RepID=A0A2A3YED1_9MICO|nr:MULTISPECIES: extracellular solute-binding protein [Brachybacterium]PCC34039.1 ABC transporter substrate-binding protein [Brachybacterium alimentarium]PCC37628.1 ABC transporter substrate-binding protein [Brachybacterium alimentarium]RCS64576.1 extracellular solute-binding protein [Brachybacterium sp. JB7]RCS71027.1 extracellular solute-binding protein [Brachybacterium alimentarium]RCS74753.1 extracellular solute-binding protein [Brachybacterium alimentarium]